MTKSKKTDAPKRVTGIDKSTPEAVKAADADLEEILNLEDIEDEHVDEKEESDDDEEESDDDETDGKADGDKTDWITKLLRRAMRRNAESRNDD